MDTNEVGVTDHQDLGVIMTCVGDLNLVDNNSTRDVWTHVNKDHKSSHKSLMVRRTFPWTLTFACLILVLAEFDFQLLRCETVAAQFRI